MPTTCAVVGCNNRHFKGSNVSYYRFPNPVDEMDRRCKWINFVSRQNEDGTPWEPQEGDRLCSDHFVSKKKSNSANSPDYVPSIYPETVPKKPSNSTSVESVARFERAQRCSILNEQERLAKEEEEEKSRKLAQLALQPYEHDHGSYSKAREDQAKETVEQLVVHHPVRRDRGDQIHSIPAEVGKINLTTVEPC